MIITNKDVKRTSWPNLISSPSVQPHQLDANNSMWQENLTENLTETDKDETFESSPAFMSSKHMSTPSVPLRPPVEDCYFFKMTGKCQYGESCKFNHPVVSPTKKGADCLKEIHVMGDSKDAENSKENKVLGKNTNWCNKGARNLFSKKDSQGPENRRDFSTEGQQMKNEQKGSANSKKSKFKIFKVESLKPNTIAIAGLKMLHQWASTELVKTQPKLLKTQIVSTDRNFNFKVGLNTVKDVRPLLDDVSNCSFVRIYEGHFDEHAHSRTEVIIKIGLTALELEQEKDMYEKIKMLKSDKGAGCVSMYFSDMNNNPPYLVLEKWDLNLCNFLAPENPALLIIAPELIRAVLSLHSCYIMHGDLKPQNLLIKYMQGYPYVKICNLDNARIVNSKSNWFNHKGSNLKFTKNWVSPEVFNGEGGKLRASLSIDVFSLGLILALLFDPNCAPHKTILPDTTQGADEEDFIKSMTQQEYLHSLMTCQAKDGSLYKDLIHKMCSIDPTERDSLRNIIVQVEERQPTKIQQKNVALENEKEKLQEGIQLKLDALAFKMDAVLDSLQKGFSKVGCNLCKVAESVSEDMLLQRTGDSVTVPRMIEATGKLLEDVSTATSGPVATKHFQNFESVLLEVMDEAIFRATTNSRSELSQFRDDLQTSLSDIREDLLNDFKLSAKSLAVLTDNISKVRQDLLGMQSDMAEMKAGLGELARSTRELLDGHEALRGLLTSLLSPSCQGTVEQIAEITKVQKSLERLEELVGSKQQLSEQMDEQQQLLEQLLLGANRLPSLAILLPVRSKTWNYVKEPARFLSEKFTLYFLCSHTLQIAPCGPEGKGYEFWHTKKWFKTIEPVVKITLSLLSMVAQRQGIPLPMLGFKNKKGDLAAQAKFLNAAKGLLFCNAVVHEIGLKEEGQEVSQLSENIEASGSATNVSDDISNLISQYKSYDVENFQKAYCALEQMLRGYDIAATCGLKKNVYKGHIAWILDDPVIQKGWRDSVDHKLSPCLDMEKMKILSR